MRLAAIDVGTNTVRLLVADLTDGRPSVIDRGRVITRLGEGVDAGRRLLSAPIERTVDAIADFAARARRARVSRIRVAGTSAVRDATNRDDLTGLVEKRAGVTLELLSGPEEGRITYRGATSELPPGDYVVCDIGGGSTELTTGSSAISLDIGSVRLRERCLHGDPPSEGEVDDARSAIDEALDDVDLDATRSLVGVAGTITTLAAVVLDLKNYDASRVHLSRMSREAVTSASDRLVRKSVHDIVALGPVERGRADVIGAGSLILASVMDRFGFDEVLVSERDILDGLVLDLHQKLA